jgi:PAS domain S-box-containing protein
LAAAASSASSCVANERASQTLREQASLLDKAQDAILVTDLQRRLTYWNKSAERLYGWTAEEVMGKVVTELFYPAGNDQELRQAFQDVVARGEWTGELQPQTKSGRKITIESRWTLVRDGAEGPQHPLINTDVLPTAAAERSSIARSASNIGTLAGSIFVSATCWRRSFSGWACSATLTDDEPRYSFDGHGERAARRRNGGASAVVARGQEGKRTDIGPAAW